MSSHRKKSFYSLMGGALFIVMMNLVHSPSFAQGVGISNTSITPDASSILELKSTNKGLLIPRMTQTQRDVINGGSFATGLIIYNTTTNQFNYDNGAGWQIVFSGSAVVNTITGTTDRIVITGTADNPVVNISPNYAGQTSITTLGTISTGTWNGSAIADNKISSALTGKTYNGLNLTPLSTGFSISGGTTAKTLTLSGDANISGTNTGDQTITLTGDISGSGTSSFAASLSSNAVTNSKLAQVATQTFKGRTSAGTGNVEDLTIAQVKTLLNLSGTNSGDQTITLTGDVTGSGTGSFTATIASLSVTYSKIQNVSATNKILGRVSAGAGVIEEISTTGTGNVVMSTSPTLTTPVLGVASGTSLTLGGGTALTTTNQTGTGSLVLSASPTLTGTPTLPTGTIATTQTAGNNSTAIATTAFVAAAVPNTSYRTILQASGSLTAGKVAGTYAMGEGDPIAVSGTGTLYPIATIYIASADYPTINGAAPKLRIRAQLYTNDVAPTGSYTFGLYPITRPATSGAGGLDIYTLGTVVTGSNGATFTTPAADGMLNAAGSDFALPADGHYVIGVITTATVANNSHLHMTASLQLRNN